jgi:hypothetical protein
MTAPGYPPGYYGKAEELPADVAQVHATLAVAEAIEAALASRRRPEITPPGIVPPVVAEPRLPGVGPLPGL